MHKWATVVASSLFWMIAQTAPAQHHTVRFFSSSGSPHKVNDLAVSPDGRLVAISTQDGQTSIVRTADGETLLRHKLAPFSMSFTADSRNLFMIAPRTTQLLNLATRQADQIAWQVPKGRLGISLESRSGKLLVSELTPGGPAAESGQLHVGDELMAVTLQGKRRSLWTQDWPRYKRRWARRSHCT